MSFQSYLSSNSLNESTKPLNTLASSLVSYTWSRAGTLYVTDYFTEDGTDVRFADVEEDGVTLSVQLKNTTDNKKAVESTTKRLVKTVGAGGLALTHRIYPSNMHKDVLIVELVINNK